MALFGARRIYFPQKTKQNGYVMSPVPTSRFRKGVSGSAMWNDGGIVVLNTTASLAGPGPQSNRNMTTLPWETGNLMLATSKNRPRRHVILASLITLNKSF